MQGARSDLHDVDHLGIDDKNGQRAVRIRAVAELSDVVFAPGHDAAVVAHRYDVMAEFTRRGKPRQRRVRIRTRTHRIEGCECKPHRLTAHDRSPDPVKDQLAWLLARAFDGRERASSAFLWELRRDVI